MEIGGWVVVVMEFTGLLSHRGGSRPDLANPDSPLCVQPPTPPPTPRSHFAQVGAKKEQKQQQGHHISPPDEDVQKTGAAKVRGLIVGIWVTPQSLRPLSPPKFGVENQERVNQANLSFYPPFFFCFSPSHTLLARIENATVVNFLLCRGAIDGALPQAAAGCLQSMQLPQFLCMCLFSTGAYWGGGGAADDGGDRGGDGGDDDDALAAALLTCFLALPPCVNWLSSVTGILGWIIRITLLLLKNTRSWGESSLRQTPATPPVPQHPPTHLTSPRLPTHGGLSGWVKPHPHSLPFQKENSTSSLICTALQCFFFPVPPPVCQVWSPLHASVSLSLSPWWWAVYSVCVFCLCVSVGHVALGLFGLTENKTVTLSGLTTTSDHLTLSAWTVSLPMLGHSDSLHTDTNMEHHIWSSTCGCGPVVFLSRQLPGPRFAKW